MIKVRTDSLSYYAGTNPRFSGRQECPCPSKSLFTPFLHSHRGQQGLEEVVGFLFCSN